jgi:hypothetical protein
MKKLEELFYGTCDILHHDDGRMTRQCSTIQHGKIQTLVVEKKQNISKLVRELAKRTPNLPSCTNAYIISEYNENTKHTKNGKEYSVYAVQFYSVL